MPPILASEIKIALSHSDGYTNSGTDFLNCPSKSLAVLRLPVLDVPPEVQFKLLRIA
ncbi:hypothetical protein DPMN_119848 [Dreissena polymorpha]|uniref:Uncharacterized protein n=1 Tax=Dreissena polymorpha TaxID=45954 RepID=A0A9D4GK02_DREPO|nr:hypothetical protein DPMN_119848 [Dreissena polymorpha]